MDSHLRSDCSHQQISCSAMDVGCKWTGIRKDFSSHQINCQWIPIQVPLLEVFFNFPFYLKNCIFFINTLIHEQLIF
jgi:hypothetical protein